LRRSVVAANGTLRVVTEAYDAGATDFSTVLVVEQNLFLYESDLAVARATTARFTWLFRDRDFLSRRKSPSGSRGSSVDEHRDLAVREDLDRLAAEEDRGDAVAAV